MPLLIFLILIIALVIWWSRRQNHLTANERQYLKRRGYTNEEAPPPAAPPATNTRLHAALDSLADISPNARERAAQTLAKLCDEGQADSLMLSPLITALADQHAAVRRAVAEALGKLNDPRAIEPLRQQLEWDDSIHFRLAAERTLARLEATLRATDASTHDNSPLDLRLADNANHE